MLFLLQSSNAQFSEIIFFDNSLFNSKFFLARAKVSGNGSKPYILSIELNDAKYKLAIPSFWPISTSTFFLL